MEAGRRRQVTHEPVGAGPSTCSRASYGRSRRTPPRLVMSGCGRYLDPILWSGSPTPTTTCASVGVRRSRDCRCLIVEESSWSDPVSFGPALADVFGPSQSAGGPDLVQLLTPEGERVHHPEFDHDFSAEELRGLYRDMVLTRRIDVEATALQRHGELGIWAQLLGQEAAQIGAGRALRPQDYVFPTYREHGVAYCKGVDPLRLLGLFRGVDQGGWDPNENNFGLYTIVIGAQTLHATGYAMGMQRDGVVGTGDPERDAAVVAHFGDGASSQGDVNEAFIFAASYNAPVVFFCQNNQWAISEPIERQTRIPLYQRALGFGFPGVRVDGNDVLATYAVTQAALQRARDGQGPTFVEAYTYRMGAHTTTDDPTRYRLSGDVESWKLKDPIQRVRVYLTRNGLADSTFFESVDDEAEKLGEHLREGCRSMPDPDVLDFFDQVYCDQTEELAAEKAWYSAYRDTFEDAGADPSVETIAAVQS